MNKLIYILALTIYFQAIFSFNVSTSLSTTTSCHVDIDINMNDIDTHSCCSIVPIEDNNINRSCCSSKVSHHHDDEDDGCGGNCNCSCCSHIVPVIIAYFDSEKEDKIIENPSYKKLVFGINYFTPFDYKSEDYHPPKLLS